MASQGKPWRMSIAKSLNTCRTLSHPPGAKQKTRKKNNASQGKLQNHRGEKNTIRGEENTTDTTKYT
jgi:hypothetical protein